MQACASACCAPAAAFEQHDARFAAVNAKRMKGREAHAMYYSMP
jgi:hypothetical protein